MRGVPCPHGDKSCPCQDGDLCHYEGPNAWPRAAYESNIEELEEYASAEDACHHCGKPLDEFGDLGCEYCDRRHPGFGTMP